MDMTELDRAAAPSGKTAEVDTDDRDHWREVVTELSSELATPITKALERVMTLADTGRIDRNSLRALCDELQCARKVSMAGQQLARLASGRLRQTHERLALTQTLKDVLTQRADEVQARGIQIKQVLKPADVIVDASLLFSLFNALLDWSIQHAHSNIEYRVDIKTWPAHARLTSRFAFQPVDQAELPPATVEDGSPLDSMTWRLLEQTAWTMGLPIERKTEGSHVVLTLEFPRTVSEQLEGLSILELDNRGFSNSTQTKALAGSHVLVVASRRDVRVQVRDAVRNMGLLVDFVTSIDEARDFCRSGLPHAVVIESVLRGNRFNEFRSEIESSGTEVVFIEIIEEGNTFEISGFGGQNMGRVGRDAILTSLPSALMFELSKA